MIHQFKKTGLIILILLTIQQKAMAQNNYDSQWKSVEKLENNGKTKDAQAAVEKIIELLISEFLIHSRTQTLKNEHPALHRRRTDADHFRVPFQKERLETDGGRKRQVGG